MIITDYANFTDELLISGSGSSYMSALEIAILSFKACCPSDLQTVSVRCKMLEHWGLGAGVHTIPPFGLA